MTKKIVRCCKCGQYAFLRWGPLNQAWCEKCLRYAQQYVRDGIKMEIQSANAEAHGRAIARTVQPLVGSLDSEA